MVEPFSVRFSDEELKQIAVDMHHGKIFTSGMIPVDQQETMLALVFMPLIFMNEELHEKFEAAKPVLLFEYYEKAGPIGVNNYPSFMSMQLLNEEEFNTVKDIHDKLVQATKGVL